MGCWICIGEKALCWMKSEDACFLKGKLWHRQSFQIVVLGKTLEHPLDCQEIQPVHPKGNQSWIFIGRTDAEAEAPVLWPPDAKSRLIGKDPDAGKNWRREEKGVTEDEMVGWRHWINGHEFEESRGDSEGQRSLACCSPWGCRVGHDLTCRLNNKENSLWTDKQ